MSDAQQDIPEANPPPLPSQLPDSVLQLGIRASSTQDKPLDDRDREAVKEFQRAANYIAAAMIFLRDNVLLEQELTHDHVKPRLLGHWGTCPGLTLIWSHLNLLIRDHDLDMLCVIGPGHGAPAALASLWIEGSLQKYYPGEYDCSREGLRNLITRFSVPGGFPSHINAETPGAIHEGGELGYALAVSFGAVMDDPDLIVACIVGDGEAETGPTATAWHAIKYIDPAESGAVLPILHANGFKISERTIFGCMDDKEVTCLFSGYGYRVRIVEDMAQIQDDLYAALDWAVTEIRAIQQAARSGKPIVKPRWPMIVLRTPKGWTGPKEVEGKIIEGSFHSHQVPLPQAKTDEEQLAALRDWLSSYRIDDLLQPSGAPTDQVLSIIPQRNDKKLGQARRAHASCTKLTPIDWTSLAIDPHADPQSSCMRAAGELLDHAFQANPRTLRLFSPDELESNKLDAVFRHTHRNFQWDQFSRARGGRVIEVLSEHTCQGFMQGYTMTGRHAVFPSYESFLGIVHTMMVQYAKFVKIARGVSWRGDTPSLNYIETSTWTRQEHNGFSHQNPSFIGAVLNLKPAAARIYLPPDANSLLSTLHHCLKSVNKVNLIIGSKHPTPVYLSASEAAAHCQRGASVWHFASSPVLRPSGFGRISAGTSTEATEGRPLPDVILVGIGVEVTIEAVHAAALLRDVCPSLRVRVVNVTDLMILASEGNHPHALSREAFAALFCTASTAVSGGDRVPVLFNYHGYPVELRGLLFGRPGAGDTRLFRVMGYREEGSTTTPFDMMLVNKVSRFDLAEEAIRAVNEVGREVERGKEALEEVRQRREEVKEYIGKYGKDPDCIYDMPAFG
ncbi:hypothetical protein VTJ83DRAFT_2851 [Remersonia thermophila]|uniref:Phosphoketolase n=1 Tax=Remersonia thermophila TaxID=72144 RepID=A0ABR4DD28_9PEZI